MPYSYTLYVKEKKSGFYSPMLKNGTIVVGLTLNFLPKTAVCIGEYEYDERGEIKVDIDEVGITFPPHDNRPILVFQREEEYPEPRVFCSHTVCWDGYMTGVCDECKKLTDPIMKKYRVEIFDMER